MFLASFQITGNAIIQIFILGALGYFLVKKNILGDAGLDALSRLVIDVTMPLLIFCQLIKDFSFSLFPRWWIFPLLSIAIIVLGLIVGSIISLFIHGRQHRRQFVSLCAFQNSGFLPLVLVAALLSPEKLSTMFIYIFLFLLGFNLLMFSLGVYMLAFTKADKFEWGSLFSPPVIATLISLALVFFGLNRLVPEFVLRPLKMAGDCTLPLAMLVVAGNLAQIHLGHIDKKAIAFMALVKLVIMPLLGLIVIMRFKIPELFGLLILIQLAVPPATTLSVITRHYKKEDLLISQGIFFGHIFSMVSIPVFLSLYYVMMGVK